MPKEVRKIDSVVRVLDIAIDDGWKRSTLGSALAPGWDRTDKIWEAQWSGGGIAKFTTAVDYTDSSGVNTVEVLLDEGDPGVFNNSFAPEALKRIADIPVITSQEMAPIPVSNKRPAEASSELRFTTAEVRERKIDVVGGRAGNTSACSTVCLKTENEICLVCHKGNVLHSKDLDELAPTFKACTLAEDKEGQKNSVNAALKRVKDRGGLFLEKDEAASGGRVHYVEFGREGKKRDRRTNNYAKVRNNLRDRAGTYLT